MTEKPTLVHLPYTPGSKDYNDSVTAGYYGYAIILTMSVLNFMYYGDLWYRRVILGRFQHWGSMLHTLWGVQAIIRPLANYMIWCTVGFFAALAMVDSPNMYVTLGTVTTVMAVLYGFRTMCVILIMLFGVWGDNPKNYTNFTDDTNYSDKSLFRALFSWGNELRFYKPGTYLFGSADVQDGADDYFYMLDIQLEAFNILAGAAAYSFFDIGLKIWEPLAMMGINFVPTNMRYFRRALYMRKLKIYSKEFADNAEALGGAGTTDEEF